MFRNIFLRHCHVESFDKGNQAEPRSGIQSINDPLFGHWTEMRHMGLLDHVIYLWSLHEYMFLVKGKFPYLLLKDTYGFNLQTFFFVFMQTAFSTSFKQAKLESKP